MVVSGECVADYASDDDWHLGGASSLAELERLLATLRDVWDKVTAARPATCPPSQL